MVENDTIELLKESNSGTKMAVSSIDEVLDKVSSSKMKSILESCRKEHSDIGNEIHQLLNEYCEEGKEPNAMAKSMSWLKTNMKLTMHESDKTIADLITDGCNMGVKSLSKYINEYSAASEKAQSLAHSLIKSELDVTEKLRGYL